MDLPIITQTDIDVDWQAIYDYLRSKGKANLAGEAYLAVARGTPIARYLAFLNLRAEMRPSQKTVIDETGKRHRRAIIGNALSDKRAAKLAASAGIDSAADTLDTLVDAANLTPEERKLIDLIRAGYNETEIADILEVNQGTVSRRLDKILEKIRAAAHS